jgi:hypothetical protein
MIVCGTLYANESEIFFGSKNMRKVFVYARLKYAGDEDFSYIVYYRSRIEGNVQKHRDE